MCCSHVFWNWIMQVDYRSTVKLLADFNLLNQVYILLKNDYKATYALITWPLLHLWFALQMHYDHDLGAYLDFGNHTEDVRKFYLPAWISTFLIENSLDFFFLKKIYSSGSVSLERGNWRGWSCVPRAGKGDIWEARAKIGTSHWLRQLLSLHV